MDQEQDDADIVVGDQGFTLVPIFDDYAYRGEHLKDYCLYDYYSTFYKRNQKGGIAFADMHPQTYTHRQFIREPAIPTLMGKLFNINTTSADEKIMEDYFCMVCALFIPWTEHQPFKPLTMSWKEFFHSQNLSPRHLRYIENIKLLHKSQEEARINRLQMKAQESHVFGDNEYEDIDGDDEIDYDDNQDGIHTSHDTMIEDTFLHSSDTSDPYVVEAIDATLDYGYFDATSTAFPSDITSIYYSSLPAKQLLNSIKPNASTDSFHDSHSNTHVRELTEPEVFLDYGTTDQANIDLITQEFSLNEDQTLAFRIVADHSLGHGPFQPQLHMGLFGEGGTGKSRLISAIRAWFAYIGHEGHLAVTAMTGVAARNINGTTIHSSLAIPPQETGDDRLTRRISEKKVDEWRQRCYLIVDEVSMLSCKLITQIHIQLGKAKSNENESFGGVNILFSGDMLQLPVVSNYPLYVRHPTWEKGHQLWRSLNAVIVLRQQMRQADDPVYAELLARIRIHAPTAEDIELLQSRIGAPLPQSCYVPIIVRRNTLRHAMNDRKLRLVSEITQTPITYCVADVVNKSGMSMTEVRQIKAGNNDALGDSILGLLPGAPLMITKNKNQPLGIRPLSQRTC